MANLSVVGWLTLAALAFADGCAMLEGVRADRASPEARLIRRRFEEALTIAETDAVGETFARGTWRHRGCAMPYRLFTPPGAAEGEPLPLVLFPHGRGALGTDNEKNLSFRAAPPGRPARPVALPVLQGCLRRSLLRRFPYGIICAEEGDGVWVLAVMHLHRKPGYWRDRV